jgi:(2Fe-2S) ferredoxin
LARALAARPDGSNATVVRAGCLGLCGAGPAVVTYPGGEMHVRVTPADAVEMAGQLLQGRGLTRRSVNVPVWYRQQMTSRLGSFVELLKRRMRSAPVTQ